MPRLNKSHLPVEQMALGNWLKNKKISTFLILLTVIFAPPHADFKHSDCLTDSERESKVIIRTYISTLLCAASLFSQLALPLSASAANNAVQSTNIADSSGQTKEATANTLAVPTQILKTGVSLSTNSLSPNSLQLATIIGLTPALEKVQSFRTRLQDFAQTGTSLESLSVRQDLWDATQKASLIIQRADLEIDFTIAEIEAENQLYEEILATFTADRDKLAARVNAASFISNGALWAVCEALAIPGYKNSKFAIPSGIVGIPAGVVPSIASMYTLKAVNGKKKTSEADPNMLAKLFGYPTNSEIEYPSSVWQFLHQVPADNPRSKQRLDQLVDRWIADSNMPAFTDRDSKKQLDVITASVAQRKCLSIGTLTARIVMLRQLHAEIWKMKRMLLELTMAVQGDKQLTAASD